MKVWNGSSWVSATALKVWDGSSWVAAASGKVWDGSSWVSFFNSFLDQQTITTGGFYDGGGEGAMSGSGYSIGQFGSITDGTFNVKSGTAIWGIYDDVSEGSGSGYLYFQLATGVVTNEGWTTMTISTGSGGSGGGVFLRTNANFFSNVSGVAWYWGVDSRFLGQGAFVSEVFTVTFT